MLFNFLLGLLFGLIAGVSVACYRLRGGRSFRSNMARVMGSTDLGGPDGNPPPPP
jgi:hypothetical protein